MEPDQLLTGRRAPSHDHTDDGRLRIACPACVESVKRDQVTAALPEMSWGDLIDLVNCGGWRKELADDEMDRRRIDEHGEADS